MRQKFSYKKYKKVMVNMKNKNSNSKNNGSTKSNKERGQVLLINYNDSQFIELCRKHKGSLVLDIRQSGWSRDETKSSDHLERAFEGRYKLLKNYAPFQSIAKEEVIELLAKIATKVVEINDAGVGVIITTFDMNLLKLVADAILTVQYQSQVFLRWENAENERGGQSRQATLPADELEQRINRLVKQYNQGHKDSGITASVDDFSF